MKLSPMKQATLSFKATKRGTVPSPKAKAKAKGRGKGKGKGKGSAKVESESEKESETVVLEDAATEIEREELDMKDKAKKYKRYYAESKERMGGGPLIHADGQTKIHHMLRVFDNSMEFGPCVGVTRMERWERAAVLGLKPPIEVRNILLTKQGSEDTRLVHPVFYGGEFVSL